MDTTTLAPTSAVAPSNKDMKRQFTEYGEPGEDDGNKNDGGTNGEGVVTGGEEGLQMYGVGIFPPSAEARHGDPLFQQASVKWEHPSTITAASTLLTQMQEQPSTGAHHGDALLVGVPPEVSALTPTSTTARNVIDPAAFGVDVATWPMLPDAHDPGCGVTHSTRKLRHGDAVASTLAAVGEAVAQGDAAADAARRREEEHVQEVVEMAPPLVTPPTGPRGGAGGKEGAVPTSTASATTRSSRPSSRVLPLSSELDHDIGFH